MTPTTAPDLLIDTGDAPWMAVALKELGKGVREINLYENFKAPLWRSLAEHTPKRHTLLDWDSVNSRFMKSFSRAAGPTAVQETVSNNREIAKYFEDARTDPNLDPRRKGRTYEVSPANETEWGWEVTAWCAAFVNWCLIQSRSPRLGCVTARSWLSFGTPLALPAYGCITIVKPGRATRSTSGHVAFYVRDVGSDIVLLGGNQSNRVKESNFKRDSVLGYRWPTKHNLSGATLTIA